MATIRKKSQNTEIAQKILGLIDLTSLNANDTKENIKNLCESAVTANGCVPAICIYSHFVPIAVKLLKKSDIKIATVTNFPHGMPDIELALFETKLAIERGSDEVDIVLPYHQIINGKTNLAGKMIKKAKKICGKKTLKVIIESGELKTSKLIEEASIISIENGADFIKTSTGKVAINATLETTEIMLQVIKQHGGECGFKAAGGVKTVAQAAKYLELTQKILGESYINSHTFRFGASSLLNDVLNILNGTTHKTSASGY
jgi:deoxyribose-phosphate aldolase